MELLDSVGNTDQVRHGVNPGVSGRTEMRTNHSVHSAKLNSDM